MGRLFVISLEGMAYNCKHCHTHLAVSDDIISKQSAGGGFRFRSSDDQVSIHDENRHLIKAVGEEEERMMMTGIHTVVDIFCAGCGSIVGWKYESAYDKAQKYKDGKFILERFKVLGPDGSNYMAVQEAQAAESDGDDV